MSNRVWHKGPPPHVGWWNASNDRTKDAWRWWSGKQWSLCVFPNYSVTEIDYCTARRDKHAKYIEWTDYWPADARVPRIDPRGAK